MSKGIAGPTTKTPAHAKTIRPKGAGLKGTIKAKPNGTGAKATR